jgi:hypothetical protein
LQSASLSRGFAFSALFDSSDGSGVSPSIAALRSSHGSKRGPPETPVQRLSRSITRDQTSTSFIGFSWGPTGSAFEVTNAHADSRQAPDVAPQGFTPRPSRYSSIPLPPWSLTPENIPVTLPMFQHAFTTPMRGLPTSTQNTLPRMSTLRKRPVSDREAMKQLIDCVGMSARKKVLESGRKPKILDANFFEQPSRNSSRRISWGSTSAARLPPAISALSGGGGSARASVKKELRFVFESPEASTSGDATRSDQSSVPYRAQPLWTSHHEHEGSTFGSEGDSETDTDAPPSPSPSPRPGSAMSFMSRRSSTPTATMTAFNLDPSRSQPSLLETPGRQRSRSVGSNPYTQDVVGAASRVGLGVTEIEELEHRHKTLLDDIDSLRRRLDALRP